MSHRISSLLVGFGLLFCLSAQATTYVPISVGDITVIIPIDDPPVATGDSFTVKEDTLMVLDVLANDADENLSSVSVSIVSSVSHGTLIVNADNQTLSYTPASNYFGADSFSYEIIDEHANTSATVTVNLTVEAVNDAPVASDISAQVNEDNALILAASAADVEGDALNYVISEEPVNGTVSVSGNQFSYTPNINFNGTDSFKWLANDGALNSLPATATITVNPINDAPQVSAINGYVDEDNTVFLTAVASDAEGHALSYSVTSQPVYGVVAVVGNQFRYTPFANFNGTDTFRWKANDGTQDSAIADATITVNPINDPPYWNESHHLPNEGITFNEDRQTNFNAAPMFADDDGDIVTISTGQAQNGTVTIGSTGLVHYLPNENYFGSETLTLFATDGSTTVSVQLTASINAVNDAPLANPDNFSTEAGTAPFLIDVLANDTDVENNSLSIVAGSLTADHGQVTVQNNKVSYVPDTGYSGYDTIYYEIQDSQGANASSTVAVYVAYVNQPPVANTDSYQVAKNSPATIFDVLANDSDPESATVSLEQIVTQPQNGSAVIQGSQIAYTPNANFSGSDSFTYRVSDDKAEYSTGTVNINVFTIPMVSGLSLTPNKTVPLTPTTLSWQASPDQPNGKYKIRLKRDTDSNFVYINHDQTSREQSPGIETRYSYSVAVCDQNHQNCHPYSDPVSVDVVSVNTLAVNNLSASADEVLDGQPVTISWSRPSGNVAGMRYLVVRKHKNHADYYPVPGTTFLDANTFSLQTNALALAGEEYQFKVLVCDQTSNIGEFAPKDTRYKNGCNADPSFVSVKIVEQLGASPTLTTITPASNAKLRSTDSISVTAVAEDDTGVSSVSFKLDNGSWQVDSSAPYSHNFGNHGAGSYLISYKATDLDGNSSAIATRTVVVNNKPVISGTPITQIGEDEAYAFTPTASDADSDVLTFTAQNLPGWLTLNTQTGELQGTPGAADVGVYSGIILRVSDGLETTALNGFTITVGGKPTVTATSPDSDTRLKATDEVIATATAEADNGVNSVSFKLNDGQWQTDSSAPYSHSFGTLAPGSYLLSFKATDTDGVESAVITRNFNVNSSPEIGGVPSKRISVGATYSFTPETSDADADTLTFSAQNLPNWLVLNTQTGVLSGTPLETHIGPYEGITLSVNDGLESASLSSFTITVAAANDWITQETAALANLKDGKLPAAPTVAQDLVGEIKGNAGVDGGAFNYSIPVSLPPGINGMQPSVALSYSSQSGLGNAGYGWSLSAGSSISRCSSIYSLDGVNRNVLMDDNDHLCLNGQRLILTSGSYGQSGSEYQTERSPNGVVRLLGGDISTSNSYFELTDNSGTVASFSERFTPINASAPLSWHMKQKTDRFDNNIRYHYSNAGNGYILLTDIYYTGQNNSNGTRRVQFEYDAATATNTIESRVAYGYGYKTINKHRLNKIDIIIDGISTDHYVLSHNADQTVSSLKHCFDTNCTELLETSFDYYTADGAVYSDSKDSAGKYQPLRHYENLNQYDLNDALELMFPAYKNVGDYDGDGFGDLVYYQADSPSSYTGVAKVQLSSDPTLSVPMHDIFNLTDDQYREVSYKCDPDADPNCSNYYTILSNSFQGDMDYNHDGRKDTVYVHEDGYLAIAITRDFSDVNATATTIRPLSFGSLISGDCELDQPIHTMGIATCNSYITDINGDGVMDLLVSKGTLAQNDYGIVAYIRQTDTNNQPTNNFVQAFSVPFSLSRYDLVDLDGDGFQDLVNLRDLTWIKLGESVMNSGSSAQLSPQPFPFAHLIDVENNARTDQTLSKLADLNGDGLQDIMTLSKAVKNTGSVTNHLSWYVAINKGEGLFEPLTETSYLENVSFNRLNSGDFIRGTNSLINYMLPFDFNNDGRTDFLVPDRKRYKYMCYENKPPYNDVCADMSENLFHYHRDLWYWKVWQATPDGTDFEEISLNDTIIGSLFSTTLVDVDLDGELDITTSIGFDDLTYRYEIESTMPEGHYVYYRNGNQFKHKLLKDVETDLTKTLIVDYQPLEVGEHYQVELQTGGFPYVNFGSSMKVVTSLKSENGIGGFNEQTYQYKNARFHLQGRGFQGFESIIVNNIAAGITTSTEYYQDFPMTGQVRTTLSTETSSGNKLSSVINNAPYTASINGVYCPYSGTSTSVMFEPETGNVTHQKVVKQTYNHSLCVPKNSDVKSFDYLDPKTIADLQANASNNESQALSNISGGTPWITHKTSSSTTWESVNDGGIFIGLRKSSSGASAEVEYAAAIGRDALPAQDKRGTSTSYSYANLTNLHPQSVTTSSANDNPVVTLTQTMDYDGFGHVKRITSTGTGITGTRWQETNYTDDGYFVANTRNSEWGVKVNASTLDNYDKRFGVPKTSTDVNGIVTTTTLNKLGLPTKVSMSKGGAKPAPDVYTGYQWVTPSAANGYARTLVRSVQAGAPEQRVYSNTLGKPVKTQIESPDNLKAGADIWATETTRYDALGRVLATENAGGGSETYGAYDVLGRAASKTVDMFPQDYTSRYTYDGLETRIEVNGAGKLLNMHRVYNSRKQLMETKDAKDGVVRYAYDGMGNPTLIKDVLGSDITAIYNDFGQKTEVNDPNQGQTTFTYNALGELLTQTDANNTLTRMTLDNLGRVTQKTMGTDVSTWVYDKVVGNVTVYGALDSESRSVSGTTYHQREFGYDSLGRVVHQTDDMGMEGTFIQRWEYDVNFGRLLGHQSASGLVTAFSYDSVGMKTSDYIPDSNGGIAKVLATFDEYETTGQVHQSTYSGNVIQKFNWYLASGQLNKVEASGLQSLDYGYDDFGNQTNLTNAIDNITKTYVYDELHRLDSATVTFPSSNL